MSAYSERGEVCERLARKIESRSSDRYQLLDVATALMVIARGLERELEMRERSRGKSAETYLVRTALVELRDCLAWVQWYADAAPAAQIQSRLERAIDRIRHAESALGSVRVRTVA